MHFCSCVLHATRLTTHYSLSKPQNTSAILCGRAVAVYAASKSLQQLASARLQVCLCECACGMRCQVTWRMRMRSQTQVQVTTRIRVDFHFCRLDFSTLVYRLSMDPGAFELCLILVSFLDARAAPAGSTTVSLTSYEHVMAPRQHYGTIAGDCRHFGPEHRDSRVRVKSDQQTQNIAVRRYNTGLYCK